MMEYLKVTQTSILFFPFIAFLFTIPYMISQYHKYGAIHTLRTIIIYSFILYLLTAYFLVILPLPSIEQVQNLNIPRMQLIPFSFVIDFLNHTSLQMTNPNTYLTALKEQYVYQVFYNLLLTVPFGIYLRYYFNCNLKKAIGYTFLLSLFFEFTQLTGLYGIYPKNYRLFDINDLMINTVGGMIGYFIIGFIQKKIPSRQEIDEQSYQLGMYVTPLRRMVTYVVDIFLYLIFAFIFSFHHRSSFFVIFLLYYFIIPFTFHGQTFGEAFFHLQIVSSTTKTVVQKSSIYRRFLFYFIYYMIPFLIFYINILIISILQLNNFISIMLSGCFLFAIFVFYIYSFISFLFLKKTLLHEMISNTEYKSTIDIK